MIELGTRIKELRSTKKMTQAEFAERLGVTKSAVSSYENGSRLPSYDILIKIARIFKVSTDNLLGYSTKSTIDVTGLTQKQINTIQDVVTTYKRHNTLYRQMINEDSVVETLVAMGLADEEETDWLK